MFPAAAYPGDHVHSRQPPGSPTRGQQPESCLVPAVFAVQAPCAPSAPAASPALLAAHPIAATRPELPSDEMYANASLDKTKPLFPLSSTAPTSATGSATSLAAASSLVSAALLPAARLADPVTRLPSGASTAPAPHGVIKSPAPSGDPGGCSVPFVAPIRTASPRRAATPSRAVPTSAFGGSLRMPVGPTNVPLSNAQLPYFGGSARLPVTTVDLPPSMKGMGTGSTDGQPTSATEPARAGPSPCGPIVYGTTRGAGTSMTPAACSSPWAAALPLQGALLQAREARSMSPMPRKLEAAPMSPMARKLEAAPTPSLSVQCRTTTEREARAPSPMPARCRAAEPRASSPSPCLGESAAVASLTARRSAPHPSPVIMPGVAEYHEARQSSARVTLQGPPPGGWAQAAAQQLATAAAHARLTPRSTATRSGSATPSGSRVVNDGRPEWQKARARGEPGEDVDRNGDGHSRSDSRTAPGSPRPRPPGAPPGPVFAQEQLVISRMASAGRMTSTTVSPRW